MEPNLWCEFATYWLYQTYMNDTEVGHDQVLQFCLDKFTENTNLALFDKHSFKSYLKFVQTLPKLNQNVLSNFEAIIGLFKPSNVSQYWSLLLDEKLV